MEGTILVAVVLLVLLALSPVVVLALFFHSGRAARRCEALSRRFRRAGPEAPTGRPLQLVAADLRRLYPAVHDPAPGTRMAKQRGAVLAYDEHLVTAATALTVATSLLQLPVNGVDRELERLRVEHALVGAGLVLRP